MASREEIAILVEKYISLAYWYDGQKNIVAILTKNLIKKIHSQLRELPNGSTSTRRCFTIRGELHAFDTGYFACRQDMLKAVKPVIEEIF